MLNITDSISRLPRLESLVGDDIGPKSSASTSTSTTFSIELVYEPLFTNLLNHPIFAYIIQNPLEFNLIHDRQLLDIQLILNQQTHLILKQQTHPLNFPSIPQSSVNVSFPKENDNFPDGWDIAAI
jgi:hypothetical protein